MSVELWVNQVHKFSLDIQNIETSRSFSQLFNLDIQNPQVSSLQNDILDVRHKRNCLLRYIIYML